MSDVLRTIADCEAWLAENDPGDDAYDGSTAPAKRELSPRERDVLVRLLRVVDKMLAQPQDWGNADFPLAAALDGQRNIDRVRIAVILDTIDPRRTDEDE